MGSRFGTGSPSGGFSFLRPQAVGSRFSLTEVYFLGFSWWLKRKEKKATETERVPGQGVPRPRSERLLFFWLFKIPLRFLLRVHPANLHEDFRVQGFDLHPPPQGSREVNV